METVIFLKDHLDNAVGSTAIVEDERANYFERCQVAVINKDDSQAKTGEEIKSKKTKKAAQ